MNMIGFVITDLFFIALSIVFFRNFYTGPKNNMTYADIDFWLFPLLVFVSVIASEALTVFSPHFKGQIASGILTGISVLAGIAVIALIKTNLRLPEIEENEQKDDEILAWICIMAVILFLCQIAALILHIIYIYIPQISFFINLHL